MNNGTRTSLTLGVVAAALALSACQSSSSKPQSGPTTSAASATLATANTPSSPDPTAQADADALAAYKGMVTSVTTAMTTNSISGLATYTSGGAYQLFAKAVADDINTNIIYTGSPQTSPQVSATSLGSPKSVTITDCFGGPGFTPVFIKDDSAGHKKGGSAVGPGQSTAPHPLTVTVVNRTGKWLVEEYTLNAGATC